MANVNDIIAPKLIGMEASVAEDMDGDGMESAKSLATHPSHQLVYGKHLGIE